MTMPYAHCKGILMGTMTMELGGKVTIECEKTGYHTELEFKLRPFLGGGEFTNAVSGILEEKVHTRWLRSSCVESSHMPSSYVESSHMLPQVFLCTVVSSPTPCVESSHMLS
jgi:hypothetical protein